MDRLALIAVVLFFAVNLSAGRYPIPPLNGPCPGGTYPTVYLACIHSIQCPYRQYCFIEKPSSYQDHGFCCPKPPKPHHY